MAKFQPGVLNPFVLICGCLLYQTKAANTAEYNCANTLYNWSTQSNNTRNLHPCRGSRLSTPPPPCNSKKITRLCSFRSLRQILERLKQECHWLRRVSSKLCAQCKLCLKTKNCFWHKEPRCSHEDCTHYVDINDKPFVCVNDLSSNSAIPQTWIQVSGQNSTGKFSRGNCNMFVTVFNKLIQLYWLFASRHVNGISPGFWYNVLLKKGAISRTFNTSHLHWNTRKSFSQVELEA